MKLNLIIPVLIILGTIGLSSTVQGCKKKVVVYTVKGKLTDNSFNKGLAGVQLRVDINAAGSSLNVKHTDLTTDASGNYSFEIERSRFTKIIISGVPDNYFEFEKSIFLDELDADNENTLDLETTAKSWVRLVFDNSDGTENDEIRYIRTAGKKDCTDCCLEGQKQVFGNGVQTEICINDGEKTTQLTG